MSADFITTVRQIIGDGTTPVTTTNPDTQVVSSTNSGSVWAKIAVIKQEINIQKDAVNVIQDETEVIQTDITTKHGEVQTWASTVNTQSGIVDSQYNVIAVTPINGNAGMHADIVDKHTVVVAKEALVAPHYTAIDTVGEAVYKGNVETIADSDYKTDVETVADAAYKAKIESVVADKATIDAAEGNAELAKEWATKNIDEVVLGQGYSAKQYAANAGASATSASVSESNAVDSENSAATSATTATAKAGEADTSALTATTKAAEANVSASNASTSAAEANTSANNATTSESNASTSSTNASASASAASTSETNSSNSAIAASNSATAADASELKSSQWAETAENTEVPGETGNYSSKHHSAKAEGHATIAENHKLAAGVSAGEASTSASAAEGYSLDSKGYRDELTELAVTANTLVAGSNASTSYDSGTGVLTMGVPQGDKGDRGDAFQVDAQGPIADRSNYNIQPKGYSYLSTDEDPNTIYFKQSDIDEDNWSVGTPFGKGDRGETGIGISSLVRTAGDSSIGSTDTYTITYTDATTTTYDIVNGNAYTDVMARAAIDDNIMTLTNKTMTSMTNQIGADTMHIKIKATEALVKGDVVKATGYNSGEDAIEVEKTSIQTDTALGVVQDDITVGSLGLIVNRGLVELLDTSAYGFGTMLYSTGSGGFTDVTPTNDYQTVGYVVKNHAINGAVYIECTDTKPNTIAFKTTLGTYTEFATAFDIAEAD